MCEKIQAPLGANDSVYTGRRRRTKLKKKTRDRGNQRVDERKRAKKKGAIDVEL